MNIKIGLKIKELRSSRGLTQEQLAETLGVTNQAISKWETENGYPDIEYILQIANFFNVTTDFLFDRINSAKQQGRAKILIVDEAKMREPYNAILNPIFETVFIDLWQDILEYAVNIKPDLILIDVATSEIKNMNTLSALKKQENTRDIPVIIVSGWCIANGTPTTDFELHVESCILLGANDYVVKPFNPYILKEKIAAMLADPERKAKDIKENYYD
jgi:transcriptional regulator with XRE-family HTH domain